MERGGFRAALVKLMWINKWFETDNERWRIKVVRSLQPGHLTGWLINKTSGAKYVFTVNKGRVRYMREYRPPSHIPKYVDEFLVSLKESVKGK